VKDMDTEVVEQYLSEHLDAVRRLTRAVKNNWAEMTATEQAQLYALASRGADLFEEGHPAIEFADAVFDAFERSNPKYQTALKAAIESAMKSFA
jgi:hypothetical protein